MSIEVFVANEVSMIEILDVEESEIADMLNSGYFPAVFRMNAGKIEYASIDSEGGSVLWVKARRLD